MMTSGQALPEPVRKMGYVSVNPPFKTNCIEEQKSNLEINFLHLHVSETVASASFTFPRIYHSFLVLTIVVQLLLG
jgi:hypothetical protein